MKDYTSPLIIVCLLAVALLFLLNGCASVDNATGTTFRERCAGYRVALQTAKNMRPSKSRQDRIALYSALVTACPPLPDE